MNLSNAKYTGAIRPHPLSAQFVGAGEPRWVDYSVLKDMVLNKGMDDDSTPPEHVADAFWELHNIFG